MNGAGYTAFKDLKKVRFILAALSGLSPGRVLEVGCGSGNIVRPLADSGWRVIGMDLDADSLRYARQHAPSCTFLAGDVTALPVRGPFDAVICSEVLEHLSEPKQALRAMREVLGPGGAFVVTVPNGWGPYELTNRALERLGVRDRLKRMLIVERERARRQRESTFNPHTPHEQHFTLGVLRRLLVESRFSIERVVHSDFISWLPYVRHARSLARVDCAVADRLPSAVVSGWYVHARAA